MISDSEKVLLVFEFESEVLSVVLFASESEVLPSIEVEFEALRS